MAPDNRAVENQSLIEETWINGVKRRELKVRLFSSQVRLVHQASKLSLVPIMKKSPPAVVLAFLFFFKTKETETPFVLTLLKASSNLWSNMQVAMAAYPFMGWSVSDYSFLRVSKK